LKNNGSAVRSAASAAFCILLAMFVVLFAYIGLFGKVSVVSVRDSHKYTVQSAYEYVELEDASAPAGVRRIYSWKISGVDSNENCICFYIAHHSVDVYIDGNLVYSLHADEANLIGASVGSNWVTVPVRQADNGHVIRIVTTPLFESAADIEPEFMVGSHLNIVVQQLKRDMPLLLIALLCAALGLLIVIVQTYFSIKLHRGKWNMIYLGVFSMLNGIRRITGARSAPLLFPDNTMVMDYVSIGAMFLCSITLALYSGTFFDKKRELPMLGIAIAETAAVFCVLLMQVLGIIEFRQMLPLSHAMMIVSISAEPVLALMNRIRTGERHYSGSWKYFLILVAGVAVDLMLFYTEGRSSHMVFTSLAVVIYSVIVFAMSIVEVNRKAYMDVQTGLVNKTHWNELMQDGEKNDESVCVMMIDLNNLKNVNDTLGHETGDELIFSFSRILYDSFPQGCTICRWGGDEFTVLLTGGDADSCEKYLSIVRDAVARYNRRGEGPQISYAAGYALSSEFPGMSRMELLSEADGRMYAVKQRMHSETE